MWCGRARRARRGWAQRPPDVLAARSPRSTRRRPRLVAS